MPRPKRDELPDENQRVARAWEDARQRNPKITQADFAAAVFGGRRRRPGKRYGGPPAEWTKRQRASDARYLRLVLEGKRRPVQLVERADRGGVVNVAIGHGNTFSSFNIRLPRGVSKLDAFSIAETPEIQATIHKQIAAWAKRYGESIEDYADDAAELRGVRRARSTPIMYRPQ